MGTAPESETALPGLFVGYARVSTEEQKLDLQTDALTRAGVLPENMHIEKVSGAKRKRPELDKAIKDLRPGDTLVVWRLDRLARSMNDLLERIRDIEKVGATFKSLTESFDTKTPGGRFLVYVLGAVAELERQLIIERTSAGIKAWRERGGIPGREIKMTPAKIKQAKALLRQKGMTVKKVAKKLKLAPSSFYGHGLSKKAVARRRSKR